MSSSSAFAMTLSVGNLPSNRLALTNKVYISNTRYQQIRDFYTHHNVPSVCGKAYLVLLNQTIPYCVEGHDDIQNVDDVCMNGLQRRFAKLSLATRVTITPLQPYPPKVFNSLEIHIDTLSKTTASSSKSKPKEIDTDRLQHDITALYDGQVIQCGQSAAIDFEGTKYEILFHSGCYLKKKSPDPIVLTLGQITATTTRCTFGKVQGSTTPLQFNGNHISEMTGSGAAPSIFVADFDFEKLGIGGLDTEFQQIFRRAFSSRIWPPSIIKQMGITHVRGMLLYGPPGCGKTLIARQIGKALNAREPKIVNGPEILNKYVGGSEEKIRELFIDAEKEQNEMGDNSMLHIVIMDEMDAICKQRGSVKDGTGVSDSVVNQLLSKIDGVDSLNNILLIGMTNRKDMIDDALLRPGRLEVHVEIGLPDVAGRIQILNIHTANMRKAKRIQPDVLDKLPDIAEKAKNFSGAELEGLVKAASSYALTRCVDVKDLKKPPDVSKLMVQYQDFENALLDIEPKFGAKSIELKAYYRNSFVTYGPVFDDVQTTLDRFVEQVRISDRTPLLSVLLQGEAGSGKTAIAAKMAVDSGYPFVRMISADEMIGYSESSKCQMIHRIFMDSYKSPLSFILIDDIERIIDYVPIGPRFSNTVLQTLLVLLKKIPPDEGRRLLVVGTTSCAHFLDQLGLTQAFSVTKEIPLLTEESQIMEVLRTAIHMNNHDAMTIAKRIVTNNDSIAIKKLLMIAEMAKQQQLSGSDNGVVDVDTFMTCLETVGI